jgi:small subunit ribosomal protein S16
LQKKEVSVRIVATMLMIRLKRVGKKHDPSFRVVLTDSRKGPKSSAFKEILGNYNAQKGEPVFDGERIKYHISKGAQVSDTVHNLLVKAGILEGKKKNVLHIDKIKKASAVAKAVADKKESEKTGIAETAEVPAETTETPAEEAPVVTPSDAEALKGEEATEDKPSDAEAVEEKTEEPKTEEAEEAEVKEEEKVEEEKE